MDIRSKHLNSEERGVILAEPPQTHQLGSKIDNFITGGGEIVS
jgi:hypothetical protein